MYIYNNAYNESSRLLNSNNIKTDVSRRYTFYLVKIFFSVLFFLTFLYATYDFIKRDTILLKFPDLIDKNYPHNDKLPDSELISSDNFINDCPALHESNDNLMCPINTYRTKISVKATKNGFWPIGLSWTLLRDEIDLNKDKSYLYSLKNMSMPTPNHSSKICKNYVVELCLYGNYVMFVDTTVDPQDSLYDQEGNDREVSVCNQNVKSGEALELVINEYNCNIDQSTFKPQLEFIHAELSLPSKNIAKDTFAPTLSPTDIPTAVLNDQDDHNDNYVTNQPDDHSKKYNDHGKSHNNNKKHKRHNKNSDDDDDYKKKSKRNSENSEPYYIDDKKIESRCEIFGTVLICDNGNNTNYSPTHIKL